MAEIERIRSKIREQMPVVTLDDRRIGLVSRIDGDTLWVTRFKGGKGFSYLIPLGWVGAVDKYVFLSRNRAYVAANSGPAGAFRSKAA